MLCQFSIFYLISFGFVGQTEEGTDAGFFFLITFFKIARQGILIQEQCMDPKKKIMQLLKWLVSMSEFADPRSGLMVISYGWFKI